jgi:prepilin-type processing-associated H-X9-DG protein
MTPSACRWAEGVISVASGHLTESVGPDDDFATNVNTRGWVPTDAWATRHNDGANYVFLDGHAKWLKPAAIDPATRDSLMSIELE